MELISLDTGRSTWLFPTEEFLPLEVPDGMSLIQSVAVRYDFKIFPEKPSREDIDKNGLKFGLGSFDFEGVKVGVTDFVAYNDGIVAVSNTTERATAFLEDATRFLISELKFRRPVSTIKKVNVSTLTVELSESVNTLFAQQAKLFSLVGEYLNAPLGSRHPTEVSRLDISLDDSTTGAQSVRPRLILEARNTVPLSRRRYYSNAAMHTKAHLELLGKIEDAFMHPSTSISGPRA
ncbi:MULTISPECIES: hypothetical protein [unclassified Bradyrhizobium]|uniref:hypothetical protein n=1 Tax=unclassified Bradyrhizobium TaxID=2631580 RepID=UPI002915D21B|nr:MULTISPECIES: hypothetical protein [unclassified Bradyrhizobium]